MNRRHLARRVRDALQDTPVVCLQGPRQCGKTTLIQELIERGHDAQYVTLDDAVTLKGALADPDGFVAALPERVALDEVQRAPHARTDFTTSPLTSVSRKSRPL